MAQIVPIQPDQGLARFVGRPGSPASACAIQALAISV